MFEIEFTGTVVRWQGDSAAWHFIALPDDLASDLKSWTKGSAGGWGSLKVQVTIGATTWSTSLFPSKQSGTFILPVKAEVRRAEGVGDGDEVVVTMRL